MIRYSSRKRKSKPVLKRTRNKLGTTIAELGAALTILLPFLIFAAYVAVSIMQVCIIKSILNQCSSIAARSLAISYSSQPTETISSPETTFSGIRFNNVVVDNAQFEIPPGAAGWNTAGNPPTVTVTVSFPGEQNVVPNYLNLNLLGLGNGYSLSSTATANL